MVLQWLFKPCHPLAQLVHGEDSKIRSGSGKRRTHWERSLAIPPCSARCARRLRFRLDISNSRHDPATTAAAEICLLAQTCSSPPNTRKIFSADNSCRSDLRCRSPTGELPFTRSALYGTHAENSGTHDSDTNPLPSLTSAEQLIEPVGRRGSPCEAQQKGKKASILHGCGSKFLRAGVARL